jgi:4-hydroxybenzoate polyprenyltransferase
MRETFGGRGGKNLFDPAHPRSVTRMKIVERLGVYVRLVRLDRPIGIFLLLWPALWALWIASEGHPDVHVLVALVIGVVLMRSAGCVINDVADRNIDPHVRRTRHRPLAAGEVSVREALAVFATLCACASIVVLTLNRLTIELAAVAIVLAVTYPFMKRYTYLPQIHLGAAFGWAVPMAFAAQTGRVPEIAWLVFIASVLWTTAYDTLYAMVDREDDIRIGVKSTAILFGEQDRLIVGLIQVLFLVAALVVGARANMGWAYHAGLMVAAALTIYQQYLIRNRVPEDCFRAFLNNNWLGFAVFLGIAMNYW